MTSCEQLKGGVALTWRGLHRDVRKSLEGYSSTLDLLDTARARGWRSLGRYPSRRDHILSLLSGKTKVEDKESEEAFTELLFPKKQKSPIPSQLAQMYKFTVPEVMSPRMQQMLRINRRPFGGVFSSLEEEQKPSGKKDVQVPQSLAKYIQEEIGKYHVRRMDRLLKVPKKPKAPERSTPQPQEVAGEDLRDRAGRKELSFLLLKSRLPALTQKRIIPSESPDLESVMQVDARQASKDLKVTLSTARLMAGSQAFDLSVIKTFHANLKELTPTTERCNYSTQYETSRNTRHF